MIIAKCLEESHLKKIALPNTRSAKCLGIFSVTTRNDFKGPLRQRNNNRSETSGELSFRAIVLSGKKQYSSREWRTVCGVTNPKALGS
ncbi:hypothetical protein CEXT_202651 [Caerostris extrusa]|uniref:Uncharacterized protein n=1 Tax=Caerostris extrusa TaxID=172846 RepID=A0AAV4RXX1_CAEEX|nr:hypothetical protein CEXT_202651 [Caerostris extrusa]